MGEKKLMTGRKLRKKMTKLDKKLDVGLNREELVKIVATTKTSHKVFYILVISSAMRPIETIFCAKTLGLLVGKNLLNSPDEFFAFLFNELKLEELEELARICNTVRDMEGEYTKTNKEKR